MKENYKIKQLTNYSNKVILLLTFGFFVFLTINNVRNFFQISDLEKNHIEVIGVIEDKYTGMKLIEGYKLRYSYVTVFGEKRKDETRVLADYWNKQKVGNSISIAYSEQNNFSRGNFASDVKDKHYFVNFFVLLILDFVSLFFFLRAFKA